MAVLDTKTPTAKLLQISDLKDKITRAQEQTSLFLAGPFIRPDKDEFHPDNNGTSAKRLRWELNRGLEAEGYLVYLGEDQRLREGGDAHFGAHNNAVVYERHYVSRHLDAVIILPSSPGSFSELGDWVTSPKICQRMLVVVDKIFEGIPSYITEGPLKFAQQSNGEVVYLDYDDRPAVLARCLEFMRNIVSQKRIRALYDGS